MNALLMLACAGDPQPAADEVVEVPESPRPGHWTRLDALAFGHVGYSATLLADGSILVFGGFSPQAEIWDATLDRTRTVATAPESRMEHAAVLLDDGRVLVVGGRVSSQGERSVQGSTVFYDPSTDSWEEGPKLLTPRADFSLDLLGGSVLACGGLGAEEQPLADCEALVDGAWTAGPSLGGPRHGHESTRIGEALLLSGGLDGQGPVAAIEAVQPGGAERVATLVEPRTDHLAVGVGEALWLIGGIGSEGVLDSVEVYEGSLRAGPPLHQARARMGGGLLPDGRVVVFGGSPIPESPDVLALREVEILEEGAWIAATRLVKGRYSAPTVPLPDGRLAFVGGDSRGKAVQDITSYSQEDKPARQTSPEDLPSLLEEDPEAPPGVPE